MSRLVQRLLFAITASSVVAMSAVVAPAAATETTAAEVMQLPFPCKEKWRGSTGSYKHTGGEIDFNQGSGSDDLGKPVVAALSGVVRIAAGPDTNYGNYIVIDHKGNRSTLYAHLDSKNVKAGQRVDQGQRIGAVGNTDNNDSILPHLHFEYRANDDPIKAASFNGVPYNYEGGDQYLVSRNCGQEQPDPDLSVAGVADGDGTLTVFTSHGGVLRSKSRKVGGGWNDWVNRGMKVQSGPAAASVGDRYFVVARGPGGLVTVRTRMGGEWNAERKISGFKIAYAPTVVELNSKTAIVLAVRADNKQLVKRVWQSGKGWAKWTYLGNKDSTKFTSGPDAAVRAGGILDVVIRGPKGHVAHVIRDGKGQWSKPHGVPGAAGFKSAAGAAPAVASFKKGTVSIVARGENGYLWRADRGKDGWARFHTMGIKGLTKVNQGPDLVADTKQGALVLLARDVDGKPVYTQWKPGKPWTKPVIIPGKIG